MLTDLDFQVVQEHRYQSAVTDLNESTMAAAELQADTRCNCRGEHAVDRSADLKIAARAGLRPSPLLSSTVVRSNAWMSVYVCFDREPFLSILDREGDKRQPHARR